MLHLIISTQSFVFLMLASFLAGFLDAIAGGGGLITIPAYLISGLPVHMVYACNKFAPPAARQSPPCGITATKWWISPWGCWRRQGRLSAPR